MGDADRLAMMIVAHFPRRFDLAALIDQSINGWRSLIIEIQLQTDVMQMTARRQPVDRQMTDLQRIDLAPAIHQPGVQG